MATGKTLKEIVKDINTRVDSINESIQQLHNIEIKVCNGKEKIITYRRSQFFQMLYDRGNVWKEKARIGARDILLFGGVMFLIVDRVFGIIK